MIIPYQVDVFNDRKPISNYLIIIAIALAFNFQMFFHDYYIRSFVLTEWSITGLIGHMWLHKNWLHLTGNLIFLWVFGNAVCAKLGNILYPILYIAAGIIAGIVHMIFDGRSAMGASGAINGVIGLYLILYPFNFIKCIFVFIFYIRRICISGFWVILWWALCNILGAYFLGYRSIAYILHIAGFIAGVIIAVILIKSKLVTKDDIPLFRQLRI